MIELLTPTTVLNSTRCYDARPLGARIGIMLHFDGSSSDKGAVAWFSDPACQVSYNRLYLDLGSVVQITRSMEHAAWHAGVCKTPNANRVYYGLAAATNEKAKATPAQFEAIAHDCAALFVRNRWPASDVDMRIVGHDEEAVPKGRKCDPTGLRRDDPILSVRAVRRRVRELLEAA